jgi:4-amino-4-deoxy-L-arabinose transferase-like glycosyltransferase
VLLDTENDSIARHFRAFDLLIIVSLCVAVFGFHLGSYRLWEPDEARYAEIAHEMLTRHSFLIPHLNYVLYIEKPPLLYWITALSMRAFGSGELAVRLPTAFFALLGVIGTWLFTLRTFDRRRALIAGSILVTTPLYAVMAQVITTDMILTALTIIALFALYLQWGEGGRWYLIGYPAIGLGTLAKGPVAIVIVVLVMALFLWREGALRTALGRLHVVAGTALTAAIAVPWFLYMIFRVPGFFSFYFIGEHLRRFLDSSYSHGGPLWFYLPVLAAGSIPWSLIAPFMRWRGAEPNPARRFCVIAASVIVIFFSIARAKLIPYVMPALGPIAVLLADSIVLTAWPLSSDGRRESVRLGVIAPILSLIGVTALAVAVYAPHTSNPYLALVRPALFAVAAVSLGGGIASAIALRAAHPGAVIGALVLTMVLALWAGSYGRIEAEPLRSYAVLAEAVAKKAPGATIVCYGRYVQAIPFYAGKRTIVIGAKTELTFGAERCADPSRWFPEGRAALLRLWHSERKIVVVLDERDLFRLAPKLGPYVVIGSEWHKRAIIPARIEKER